MPAWCRYESLAATVRVFELAVLQLVQNGQGSREANLT
jgi:hypothetical protein